MAAKNVKEDLKDIKFKTKAEEVAFMFGWNAATLAAEEKFTTHNRQSVPCDRCGQPIPILKGTFVVNKPF